MSPTKPIGTVRRCGVPEQSTWEHSVATEVRGLLAGLSAHVSMQDVAVSMGVARRTLYRWRTGDDSIPAYQLLRLRALAAEVAARRAV